MQRILTIMRNLNGWQRLWLLVCTVAILGVFGVRNSSFPTESQWRLDAKELASRWSASGKQEAENIKELCHAHEAKSGEFIDYLLCMKVNNYMEMLKSAERHERSALENGERLIREELIDAQLKHLGVSFLMWLFPSVFLYCLGLGIAWVRRGFANRS